MTCWNKVAWKKLIIEGLCFFNITQLYINLSENIQVYYLFFSAKVLLFNF